MPPLAQRQRRAGTFRVDAGWPRARSASAEALALFRPLLEDASVLKVMQNAK